MKKLIKNFLKIFVKSELIWYLLTPLLRVASVLQVERRQYIVHKNTDQNKIKNFFNKPIVRHGPFEGMKYQNFDAYGSAISPKFLGSYEKELQTIIEKIIEKKYEQIFDIGCAEGYYAIGLAKRIPEAEIFAFDTDTGAQKYCQKMAELNNVSNRVKIKSYCSEKDLATFNFSKKSLIISDCEGCEMEIFTKNNIQNFKNVDLLIEIHDWINIEISTYLTNLFKDTHEKTIIKSLDDIVKAKTYNFPELNSFDLKQRKEIVSEYRPSIMEWYYLEAKTITN